MASDKPPQQFGVPHRGKKHGADSTNRVPRGNKFMFVNEQQPQQASKFLFVNEQDNKDPNYTSLATKHAWVKSRSSRLKKEKQLKALKASAIPFPGSQSLQVSKPGVSSLDFTEFTDHQRSQVNNEDDRYKPLMGQTIQAGLYQAVPHLPTNTIQSISFYCHHYRKHASHATFPLGSEVMSLYLYQEGLEQPALIETLLFLSAANHTANLKSRDASPHLIESSMQDTLRLRSRVLKSLQALLLDSSQGISEKTILTICHLACIESAQANAEGVKAHMVGLQYIINALGGLEKLEIRTLSAVYCFDIMKGLVLDTPPMFKISKKWEKWIKTNSICIAADSRLASHSELGKRFFTSSWSLDLPEELVSIIKGFQHLIPCYEQMVENERRNMLVENDYLLYLIHRLYMLPYKMTFDPFLEALCISLQVYTITRIWEWRGKPCFDSVGRIFRQKIENVSDYLFIEAPDLLFWSLFHGCLLTAGIKHFDWFFTKLKECAKILHISDLSQALPVLEGFFFKYRLIDEPSRELTNSLFPPKITLKEESAYFESGVYTV
ncbi:hypothetical protein N7456_010108 [Penicillium angulare]|uniref:Uncharacterized protein n=1 Tax=Penicillium angulare TaxID=116970 RepID=A0A9W9K6R9_9EURO|nr:hypothetical protein N7456_010108 [Penicillium angulare]